MGWVSLLCPTHCSRVCPCSSHPVLFLPGCCPPPIWVQSKRAETTSSGFKVVCPAALSFLVLEGLGQCKAGEEFSREHAALGGEMAKLSSQHLSSCPSLDKREFGELQCFAICWAVCDCLELKLLLAKHGLSNLSHSYSKYFSSSIFSSSYFFLFIFSNKRGEFIFKFYFQVIEMQKCLIFWKK